MRIQIEAADGNLYPVEFEGNESPSEIEMEEAGRLLDAKYPRMAKPVVPAPVRLAAQPVTRPSILAAPGTVGPPVVGRTRTIGQQAPVRPSILAPTPQQAKQAKNAPYTPEDFAGLTFSYEDFMRAAQSGGLVRAGATAIPFDKAYQIMVSRTGKTNLTHVTPAWQLEENEAIQAYGKAPGFNRNQKDADVPRGNDQLYNVQFDKKTGEKKTLSQGYRKKADEVQESTTDYLKKAGLPDIVSTILGGIVAAPLKSHANFQTFKDTEESAQNVSDAVGGMMIDVAAGAVGEVAFHVLKPTFKALGKLAAKQGEKGIAKLKTFATAAKSGDKEAAVKAAVELGVEPKQAARIVEKLPKVANDIAPDGTPVETIKPRPKPMSAAEQMAAKKAAQPAIPEPVRPVETPKVVEPTIEPRQPSGDKFAASNAASNDLRAKVDLPELPKTPKTEAPKLDFDEDELLKRARTIREDVSKGKKAPVLSAVEQEQFGQLEAAVGKRLNDVKDRLVKAYERGEDVTSLEIERSGIREDVDAATLANKFVGTEWSVSGRVRNQAFTEDLTPAGQYREWTLAKKGKLEPKEAAEAEGIGKQLEELKKSYDDLKSKYDAGDLQKSIVARRSKVPKTQEQILSARAAASDRIKEKIAARSKELAGRANSIEGVASTAARALADIAPDVMELAQTFIDEGVLKASDLVAKVVKHSDELGLKLTEQEASDIIEGRFAKPKRVVIRSEAATNKRAIVAELKANRKAIERAQAEAARIEKDEVSRLTREALKKDRVKSAAEAKAMRQKVDAQVAANRKARKAALDDLFSQQASIENRIAKLDEQIKSGEFPKAKPKKKIPDDLQEAAIKLEAKKVEASTRKAAIENAQKQKEMSFGQKAMVEALAVPRSIIASTDLSAPLNQGAFAMYAHPVTSIRALGGMFKGMTSEDALFKVMGQIRADRPMYEKAIAAKLQLSVDGGLDPGGDMFLSNLIGHPLEVSVGKAKLGLNPIAMSERAYSAYLNKLRMDMFSGMVKSAEKPFLGKSKPLTMNDYEAIAEWVNVSTGAGVGDYAAAIKQANRKVPIMFAPGYLLSRWQLAFGGPGRMYQAAKSNKRVAALILADYVKFLGAAGGVLYAAKASGADVEMDSRSSTFGKIKLPGGTTIDPFGGILQPYRFANQITRGSKRTDGSVTHRSRDAIGNYLGNKAAPIISLGLNISDGKAYGKSYDVNTTEGQMNVAKSFLPIQLQTQGELNDDKSMSEESKAVIRILSVFGLNAQPAKK